MTVIPTGKRGRPRRLTTEQALAVVALAQAGHSRSSLARYFNVHRRVIQRILSGETYGDVTGIPRRRSE